MFAFLREGILIGYFEDLVWYLKEFKLNEKWDSRLFSIKKKRSHPELLFAVRVRKPNNYDL